MTFLPFAEPRLFGRRNREAMIGAVNHFLWEALARHVLIVFGTEIRGEKDAAIPGPQHLRLLEMELTVDAAVLSPSGLGIQVSAQAIWRILRR